MRVPHPCVFCKGGRRCCVCYLIWLRTRDKPTWCRHFRLPPFAKSAKDGAPTCVGKCPQDQKPGPPALHQGFAFHCPKTRLFFCPQHDFRLYVGGTKYAVCRGERDFARVIGASSDTRGRDRRSRRYNGERRVWRLYLRQPDRHCQSQSHLHNALHARKWNRSVSTIVGLIASVNHRALATVLNQEDRRYVPAPLSETFCSPPPSSLMLMRACRLPLALGVNVTLIVQFAPGLRVDPQLLV